MELRNKKKNIFLELKELEKKKINGEDENSEKDDMTITIEEIYKYVEKLDKEKETKEREREEKEREVMMTMPDFGSLWDFSNHDWVIDEVNYKENYVKKDLERIAEYYGISKRKKKKDMLIQEIIQFEQNISNWEKTQRRKELWSYIEELKSDKYTSKFIVF